MPLAEPTHLHDLVSRHGTNHADGIALYAPGRESLTYHDLAVQVERTGAALGRLGVARTDRVALALPNGPELATAFLGVAAHAQCAPLNPGYQAAELDHFLADLRARALIASPGADGTAAKVARARGIPVFELVADPAVAGVFELRGEQAGPAAPDREGRPEDVGMILYTSGTIARPRRVPLTHTNLCVAATNTGRWFGLEPADRCLNVMPMFHAHGLTSTLLASLVFGASVICPPAFDADRFFQWLGDFRPTWYTAVPAMHRALLDAAAGHQERVGEAALRFIRSASAPLPGSVLDELERTFRAPVIEGYGMTEAGSLVTSNPLPPGTRKRGSVGAPVGEDVTIMDPAGSVLAAGEYGEIAIRGANVMRGYGDDPEANAAAFAGEWLRTGDYGYLDEDGYLFIVGRVKEIINRGGAKVAPAEVDEALADHPDIAQVAAFALPHETLGEDVAVAVVPCAGRSVTEREVRAFAMTRLVDYKVPSRVFVVDEVPRNTTGKVQRLRLAEQFGAPNHGTAADAGTATERAVAAIWADVLRTDRVALTANFFDLNGDSLMLVRVAGRLKEQLGREVPVSVLLMHPTVRSLARHLDEGTDAGPGRPAPAADVGTGDDSRARMLRQRRLHADRSRRGS